MRKSSLKRKSENGKKNGTIATKNLFSGLNCFVETINEDGTDASAYNTQILQSMGAAISEGLGEQITHFISSNSNNRRILAAELLGILVVSPLWIEQCVEAGKRVSEKDFSVKASSISTDFNLVAAGNRSSDIQTSSIQQSVFPVSGPPSILNEVNEDRVIEKRGIPLPSFREFVPPVIPERKTKYRRSDRLSDLMESDEEEEEVKKKKESLEEVLKIKGDQVLPVIYSDLTENTEIPVKTVNKEKSKNNSKISKIMKPIENKSERVEVGVKVDFKESVATRTRKRENKKVIEVEDNEKIEIEEKAKKSEKFNETIKTKSNAKHKKEKPVAKSKQIDVFDINTDKNPKMIIGFSGFNAPSYTKLVSKLRAFIMKLKNKEKNLLEMEESVGLSVERKSKKKDNEKDNFVLMSPFESSIEIVEGKYDLTRDRCTHLIVNQNSPRTLKVLFAVARGIWVVREDWIYDSVDQEKWVSPANYFHERFGKPIPSLKTLKTRYKAYEEKQETGLENRLMMPKDNLTIFSGFSFFVLAATDPSVISLKCLIECSGGDCIKRNSNHGLLRDCNYVVFGDVNDASEWLKWKKSLNISTAWKEIDAVKEKIKENKVLTAKYLFNCIEYGDFFNPSEHTNSLIKLEEFEKPEEITEPEGVSSRIRGRRAQSSNNSSKSGTSSSVAESNSAGVSGALKGPLSDRKRKRKLGGSKEFNRDSLIDKVEVAREEYIMSDDDDESRKLENNDFIQDNQAKKSRISNDSSKSAKKSDNKNSKKEVKSSKFTSLTKAALLAQTENSPITNNKNKNRSNFLTRSKSSTPSTLGAKSTGTSTNSLTADDALALEVQLEDDVLEVPPTRRSARKGGDNGNGLDEEVGLPTRKRLRRTGSNNRSVMKNRDNNLDDSDGKMSDLVVLNASAEKRNKLINEDEKNKRILRSAERSNNTQQAANSLLLLSSRKSPNYTSENELTYFENMVESPVLPVHNGNGKKVFKDSIGSGSGKKGGKKRKMEFQDPYESFDVETYKSQIDNKKRQLSGTKSRVNVKKYGGKSKPAENGFCSDQTAFSPDVKGSPEFSGRGSFARSQGLTLTTKRKSGVNEMSKENGKDVNKTSKNNFSPTNGDGLKRLRKNGKFVKNGNNKKSVTVEVEDGDSDVLKDTQESENNGLMKTYSIESSRYSPNTPMGRVRRAE